MTSSTMAFDREAILGLLSPTLRARLGAIEFHDSIDSTQAELLRRGSDQPDGSVLIADRQTAGRGRRGRSWVSPPGANLYLSLFRRVDGGLRAQAGLSLALGVAACEAVRACGAEAVALKWPNDLVAGARKLGGLLVETLADGRGVVAGIGINRHLSAGAVAGIEQPWTDLATLGVTASRARLAVEIIAVWRQAFDDFAQAGLAPFAVRWQALDVLADAPVRVLAAQGEERHGIARGIDGQGALLVEIDGAVERLWSGDVSLRRA